MNPTIHDGDVVAIRPLDATDIRRGSVVLYKFCGRCVVHRAILNEKRTSRVFMVGDAAVQGGDWISAADILGVAESARRDGKTRRLDGAANRFAGLLRFALRPVRRALWNFRQTHHAQTPDRWNS